ncbi:MAG: hypothetical protein IJW75_05515, partial [Alphaproteobacteria bacterium]|nr:hypothetical protein [Alphaproteobacteria bacterium]
PIKSGYDSKEASGYDNKGRRGDDNFFFYCHAYFLPYGKKFQASTMSLPLLSLSGAVSSSLSLSGLTG